MADELNFIDSGVTRAAERSKAMRGAGAAKSSVFALAARFARQRERGRCAESRAEKR
jgi:hypothetical protein